MLSINPPTGKWTYVIGIENVIVLTWEAPMDVSDTPPNGSWTTTSNGVPKAVNAQTWLDATHLELSYAVPSFADPVYLTYAGAQDGLRTAQGKMVEAFGPILIPDPPWWRQSIQGWMNDHPPPPLADPGHPAWHALHRVYLLWLERQHEQGNL